MGAIRVGIIGTGGMANTHAVTLKKEPDVRITACCDLLRKTAEAFAAKHEIPAVYSDYRELLAKESLDAVSVVTSDAAHCEVSVAAFRKGLHVLCEKPIATSSAEAARMLRAARASGKIHMINFSYRSFPALDRARQLVADGELGAIRHVEASYLQCWLANEIWGDWHNSPWMLWRMSRKHSGGTLADIGCHILDFTTYVVGGIVSLHCSMKCFPKGLPQSRCKGYKLDADDSFFAAAEFASGALGVIHATRWATGHANRLRLSVFGDRGALVLDSEAGSNKLQLCLGKFHARNLLWNELLVRTPETPVIARFIRAIRSGQPEAPTFEDGARARAYQDACIASAETGRPARVRLPR
jgi:predicted dehydrogenase